MRRIGLCFVALLLLATKPGLAANDASCFARGLPPSVRPDDVKLLIGFVFDAAAAHHALAPGDIIDRHSGLKAVPGFAGATSLDGLAGRYRVMRVPFDLGHGYFGVELGAVNDAGGVSSLYLVNRLFRLPIILHQPVGVATDLVTNAAMLMGWKTQAIVDANSAAAAALEDARRLHVLLLTAGQSQAGGVAQLQAASAAASHRAGFITLNAAYVVASVRRLGSAPDAVGGINFVSDLDPGFGPHGVLPNRMGLQVYIHPGGSGGGAPGGQTMFAALRHPGQHLLSSFNTISLRNALAHVLGERVGHCPG